MELARRVSRAAGEETPWDREEVRLVPTDSEARRTWVGWARTKSAQQKNQLVQIFLVSHEIYLLCPRMQRLFCY